MLRPLIESFNREMGSGMTPSAGAPVTATPTPARATAPVTPLVSKAPTVEVAQLSQRATRVLPAAILSDAGTLTSVAEKLKKQATTLSGEQAAALDRGLQAPTAALPVSHSTTFEPPFVSAVSALGKTVEQASLMPTLYALRLLALSKSAAQQLLLDSDLIERLFFELPSKRAGLSRAVHIMLISTAINLLSHSESRAVFFSRAAIENCLSWIIQTVYDADSNTSTTGAAALHNVSLQLAAESLTRLPAPEVERRTEIMTLIVCALVEKFSDTTSVSDPTLERLLGIAAIIATHDEGRGLLKDLGVLALVSPLQQHASDSVRQAAALIDVSQ
eukprot:TRINITY_DN2413_c0_g1_i2.p1 TRINITY_DN2413_c0_g1~~TRINITY_DN2413_c0_g1_i2.p1  ORF type:complete len:332 (+),score=82.75 TRINITY_DN2413_c0_g1_i2:474-1469(+)